MKKLFEKPLSVFLTIILILSSVNLASFAANYVEVVEKGYDLCLNVFLDSMESNRCKKTDYYLYEDEGFAIYPDSPTTITYKLFVGDQEYAKDVKVEEISCYYDPTLTFLGDSDLEYEINGEITIDGKSYAIMKIKNVEVESEKVLFLKFQTPCGYSGIFSNFYAQISKDDRIDDDSTPGNAIVNGSFKYTEDDEDVVLNDYNFQAYPYGLKLEKTNNTLKIVDYIGNDVGDFFIPSKIDGMKVTEIAANAFDNKTGKLTKVFIPSCVENISRGAFSWSTSVKEFVLSEGIKTIGALAFYSCEKLEKINFPSTISNISAPTIGGKVYYSTVLAYNVGMYLEEPNPEIKEIEIIKNSYSEKYFKNIKDNYGNETFSGLLAEGEKIYTVHYDYSYNGGDCNIVATRPIKKGDMVNLSLTATKQGSTFLGWNTNPNATKGLSSLTANVGDITLYPIWRADDTIKPTCSISSTNDRASSQTVTLTLSDNVGVAGYYWGTNSSYSSNKYTTTSSSSVTKTISDSGTYYLTVRDTSGNISETESITFYKTTLDANGGYVTPSYIITKSGRCFSYPTPIRDGYIFKGWSTSSSATSGYSGLCPVGNKTYYAVWSNNTSSLLPSEIYKFNNSYTNFGFGTYTILDSDFNKLVNYVKANYNSSQSLINKLQENRNSAWGGSCYGMSATVLLDRIGHISFNENFDADAATMYDVDRPLDNVAVMSAINYYQIAQFIPFVRDVRHCSYNYISTWSKTLKNIVEEGQEGEPFMFIYAWDAGCHAIVIKDYKKNADGSHKLIAYDNRYPSRDVVVAINSDFTTCIVDGDEDAYYVEYTTDFSGLDKIDIDGPNNDLNINYPAKTSSITSAQFELPVNANITIKNSNGEKLTYNNGVISGNMKVISNYMLPKSTESGEATIGTIVLEVSDSEVFEIESASEDIEVNVLTDKVYASASATNSNGVVFDKSEGIYALGEHMEYDMSITSNMSNTDMISISGKSVSDVSLVYSNKGIVANGVDGEACNVTVFSNIVDVDEKTFKQGYSTVMITAASNKYGDIDIFASANNNGVYDVSIMEGKEVDIEDDCSCKCHKGGIAGFFYKIVIFFQKLFGKNKICACGVKH